MRIYFSANTQAPEKLQQRLARIIDILNEAGVLVMSNVASQNITGFSTQDIDRLEASGEVMMEKIDALVIEGTTMLPESAYLIAIALAHHKPILYFSEKGAPVNKNLSHLKKDKNAGKLIFLEHYTDATLEEIIQRFLQQIEKGEEREVPNIKFTLRITPRIERYLHWKTHNTKLSKADFLRGLLERLIDEDEGYMKFVSKRKDDHS